MSEKGNGISGWLIGYITFFILAFWGFITLSVYLLGIAFIGFVIETVILLCAVSKDVAKEMEKINQRKQRIAQSKEELKQYASFSSVYDSSKHTSYKTLFIKKRLPQFADSFTIERVMLTPMSYNPEKYIFTSATVGGITTGGIDKVGGNYVSGKKVDSGKCELKYLGQKIQRIQLTAELYKEAQKSAIKKYLNDKKQIVLEDETSGGVVISAQLLGVHSLTTQQMLYKGYPTREKCQEIIDWICDKE